MFQIMSMLLMNINPQKEIFHNYDFPVIRPQSRPYRDPKLDTYRRIITQKHFCPTVACIVKHADPKINSLRGVFIKFAA